MPLDGKQLDELLSGFIDGELTDEELELVEKAARDDVRIAQQIESLRRQSSWVWQVGQSQLSHLADRTPKVEVIAKIAAEITAERHAQALPLRLSTEAIIAEAQRRGRELGLPATHHVRLAADDQRGADHTVQLPAPVADESRDAGDAKRAAKSRNRRNEAWLALGGLVAAAAVLVAVTWPKLQLQNFSSTPSNQLAQRDGQLEVQSERAPDLQLDRQLAHNLDSAVGAEGQVPAESLAEKAAPTEVDAPSALGPSAVGEVAASSLVGMSDGLAYALVVDVEVSAQAERGRVLEKLLTSAGIPLAPPVAVNAEILKALDDSRLVVRDPASKVHAVSIQVVRGGLQELDGALRRVWQDSDSFPNVGLNLSIDSRAALMREMLRSSGDRFAPTDRFAVPLAFDSETLAPLQGDVPAGRSSPLMADDAGVQYVSNSQRENGWESLGEFPETTSQTLATILLVIHYAD